MPPVRNIPSTMDPAVVSAIDVRLDDVEADHDVRIPWAIESGSRAWGFPSPDSDDDCRFLYISRTEDYLSLRRRRDVIETPLDKIFDVNGWDVRKALGLMVKGNATVGEWLRSPIVYRGDTQLRDTLPRLADDVVDRFALTRHHLHVARNQLSPLAEGGSIKKFFYVLRPAMTLRWLRVHDSAVPPMALGRLLEESEVSDRVRRATDQLVAEKARTREMGQVPIPCLLQELVDEELLIAESLLPGLESAREGRDKVWARADAAFLDLLDHRSA